VTLSEYLEPAAELMDFVCIENDASGPHLQLPTSNFQLPTSKVLSSANKGTSRASIMSDDWNLPSKPYDLRERLFQFACVIVRVVEFLHTRGPVAKALSYQVLKAGTSAGSNYEEADDGSSARDKLAKRKICLRELKETRYRLRVCRKSGYLVAAQDPVINESDELVRIVATLVKKGPSGK
jgi:four helix bundle protein